MAGVAAAAEPVSTVVLYSERGDPLGNDRYERNTADAHMWGLRDDDTITIESADGPIRIAVDNGKAWDQGLDWYRFEFASQSGEPLSVGRYEFADWPGVGWNGNAPPPLPVMWIGGNGHSCGDNPGWFEILDLHRDHSGAVDRLWVIFEARCYGGPTATYGEIRIGEPSQVSGAVVAPVMISRPNTQLNMSDPLPIWVRADDAGHALTDLESDSDDLILLGDGWTEDWPLADPECIPASLPANEPCVVGLLFDPPVIGVADATLDLPITGVGTLQTRFGGTTIPRTRVSIRSNVDDAINPTGEPLEMYHPYLTVLPSGGSNGLTLAVDDLRDGEWTAQFIPPAGRQLAVGHYPGARGPGSAGNGPKLLVARPNQTCATPAGSYTVHEVTYAVDASVASLSVSFEQHCDGDGIGTVGIIDYRATTPARFFDFIDPELDQPSNGDQGLSPTPAPASPSPPRLTSPLPTAPRLVSSGPVEDRTAPTVSLSSHAIETQNLKAIASKGLALELKVSEGGRYEATLQVNAATAKGLNLRHGRVLGTGTRSATKNGTLKLTVKLSRTARAAIRGLRRVRCQLVMRATDNSGNVRISRRTVVLKA